MYRGILLKDFVSGFIYLAQNIVPNLVKNPLKLGKSVTRVVEHDLKLGDGLLELEGQGFPGEQLLHPGGSHLDFGSHLGILLLVGDVKTDRSRVCSTHPRAGMVPSSASHCRTRTGGRASRS